MLALLIAVRDFLLAAALAWVGVTMESARVANPDAGCAGETCQVEHDR
jgi:hypothetical protein